MKFNDAQNISNWKALSQSNVYDVVGETPVPTIEVGDSIVHNTTDNIRKVVDIVPDAKMPDAYVKFHFEDGGAMTMPTKSTVLVPSTYKTTFVPHKNPDFPDSVERAKKHGEGPSDRIPVAKGDNYYGKDLSIFHGMTLEEANPNLSAPRGRADHFSHGSTEHL